MEEIVIFDLPKVSINKWYAGCHWTKRQKLKEQYLWLVKRRISVYPITVSYFFEFKTRPLDASNCVAMIKLIEEVGELAGGLAKGNECKVKDSIGVALVVLIILAKHSGKKIEDIDRDTERDNFMSAEEAAAYGLIDSVKSIL